MVVGLSDFEEIIAALDGEAWHGTDEDYFMALMMHAIDKLPVARVVELGATVLEQHDNHWGKRTAANILQELAWESPTELSPPLLRTTCCS